MNARPLAASIVLALVAAACGGGEPPAASGSPESAPSESSGAFAPLADSLERAEGVQSTIDAGAEETRRRIEEAEQ